MSSKRDPSSSSSPSGGPSRPPLVAVAAVGGQAAAAKAPVQWTRWRRRCRACARLAVSTRTFRRLALANAVMLRRDRRVRRDGAADRLGPRLRALAGLPRRAIRSRERLPLATSSSRTGSSRASRSSSRFATWLASLLAPAAKRWLRWVAGLAFLGTLPAGAARRDHRLLQAEPLARRHALPALDRASSASACWSRSRRGTSAASAGAGGAPRARARRRRSPAAPSSSRGISPTAAGPHSGSVEVPRVWSFQPAVYVHVRATAVFGIAFAAARSPAAGAGAAASARRPRRCSALLVAQMIVGEIQYRTRLPLVARDPPRHARGDRLGGDGRGVATWPPAGGRSRMG